MWVKDSQSDAPDAPHFGLLTGVAVFLARPVEILIALFPVKMPLQEKLFIGWVGLRGAAPIVLATFPLLAGVPKALYFFHLVFFVVLASVLLQGTTVQASHIHLQWLLAKLGQKVGCDVWMAPMDRAQT
ncbi:cation:proton antiporter [Ktedonobacter sp. SOSP1-52]|uniref:cation:proton antiporter domain-containing protein n=1 Tax=Ktedonobacter sp. SOSP1-52 TaxID=2778366 RepID=UPI001915BB83